MWMGRAREADDLAAFKALSDTPEVARAIGGPQDVRRLWDVCRIPDFRGISGGEHAGLLARIFGFLQSEGRIPTDWLARAIARIDRTEGDIDALSKRLAYIRTWTYVAQRPGWVVDETHWRAETRAVEDRLSDALHARLTQRFVDRRTSVLLRRLKQKESLVAEVKENGEVTVEGEFAGRLDGFRFRQDATASSDEARTLRAAAYEALKPEFARRADRFYNAPDTEFDLTEQGGLMWGTDAVGKLVRGPDATRPQVEVFVDEEADPDVAQKVRRRLQHYIDRRVTTLFEPLMALARDEALTGLARGFAFQLVEAMGILTRDQVAEDVKSLDQEARASLRKHGVRFGQFTIFVPLLLKPAPTRLRLVLWSLWQGLDEFPQSPPPGLVTIPHLPAVPFAHYLLAGYRPAGDRAIRIDMLERLADLLRARDSRSGFEASADMLSITGLTLEQFADLMEGLGYRAERAERPRQRAAAGVVADAPAALEDAEAKPETETEAEVAAISADTPPATPAAPAAPDETAAPVADLTAGPASDAPPQAADLADDAVHSKSDLSGDETDAAPAAAQAEVEVFFTFTWAPRPRARRPQAGTERGAPRQARPRGDRNRQPAGASPAQASADAASPHPKDGAVNGAEAKSDTNGRPPRSGRPHGSEKSDTAGRPDTAARPNRSGKPDKMGMRGTKPDRGPRTADAPRSFDAGPRTKKENDPDNPFAVLASLRDRI
jgi:ATP-dependent RNA helicase SUPV3L1/SUV3